MRRRSFFQSLIGAATAVALDWGVKAPKFDLYNKVFKSEPICFHDVDWKGPIMWVNPNFGDGSWRKVEKDILSPIIPNTDTTI